MGTPAPLSGPDLAQGVELSQVPDGGMLLGHVHGEATLLVRRGAETFAVGATCSHYSGPLAEGRIVGEQVRCPWHHACFDLRTGEASGPGLDPLPCWKVEHSGTRVIVAERLRLPAKVARPGAPASVLIIGGGAAGSSTAETLRREGYLGEVTILAAENTVPVDRPNLSKDTLAGTAPEAWVAMRSPEFYAERKIDLLLGARAVAIDVAAKAVRLADGTSRRYGALVLATGAVPIPLAIPGSERPHVHTLRSLADCRAILARAGTARRAVVVGASFIGLEVAASLRTRGLEVQVVAPDALPLQKVLGPQLGELVRKLHEAKGVVFHLGHTLREVGDAEVTLDDGTGLPCDLVVAGIGVHPAIGLAEQAGLRLDRGVAVDEFLRTSAPGVYAAGDIARWPDPHGGKPLRIEHWLVAQRQGETVARNLLGHRQPFRTVPFFWSQHYDLAINYVGHAEGWDQLEVAGDVAAQDCLVAYRTGGRIAAIASVHRDGESLEAEALFEQGDQAGLEALMKRGRP